MKLATLKAGGRDGTLVVVRRDLSQCVAVPQIARTLQAALDDWERCAPLLQAVSDALNAGTAQGATRTLTASTSGSCRRCARASTSS